ncbi:hypothetical protein [Rhizobium hainanense]|uniref:Uncharacterized protein n=1 Tax=Rhizobium hainanense TaxID=52131 RepID=A0A1C3U1R2_9HYPH|nr:hypothetical protein [Rhizobium hainanense]SCB09413.1 hypothetical protein GA0061100_101491 [Rhizobium hainanense]
MGWSSIALNFFQSQTGAGDVDQRVHMVGDDISAIRAEDFCHFQRFHAFFDSYEEELGNTKFAIAARQAVAN